MAHLALAEVDPDAIAQTSGRKSRRTKESA